MAEEEKKMEALISIAFVVVIVLAIVAVLVGSLRLFGGKKLMQKSESEEADSDNTPKVVRAAFLPSKPKSERPFPGNSHQRRAEFRRRNGARAKFLKRYQALSVN